MNKYTKILTMITTCLAIGYLSGMNTKTSIATWYVLLKKPVFNPPNWVFAPVWTVLYLFMGLASGLVWNKIGFNKTTVRNALLFFAIQLGLNALWSYLFFGLQNTFLALLEIIVFWLLLYETYLKFSKIDKIAGYLMVPYFIWVSFASVLNASIWWLNR